MINDNNVKISRDSIIKLIRNSEKHQQLSDYSREIIHQLTKDENNNNISLGHLNARLFEEYFSMYIKLNPSFINKYVNYETNKEIDAYLIKEQRLYKIIPKPQGSFSSGREVENIVSIYTNATALANKLSNNLALSDKIGRDNESSYVNRLVKGENHISEAEFNRRYSLINAKKKALSKFNLYTIEDESVTTFSSGDAKALAIFLDDTEKKLAVFDTFLKKLELFAEIITKRSFINKSLKISPDYGFKFVDSYEKEIDLENLSSGEQHELILMYELIFNIDIQTIVLIDEPEISLHVVWQKEFLKDLKAIIELNKSTVIVATHSPQIINDEWDKAIDLYDISKVK